MRHSVRMNATKGRKKFLTCLQYIRESGSSRYFTRVSEVAKQTPPTLSLSPSPPYFAPSPPPRFPPCTTCYSPFKRRCISALYTFTLLLLTLLLCWGVARCLPLCAGLYFHLTVKVNGATSLVETAASFNWDAEP